MTDSHQAAHDRQQEPRTPRDTQARGPQRHSHGSIIVDICASAADEVQARLCPVTPRILPKTLAGHPSWIKDALPQELCDPQTPPPVAGARLLVLPSTAVKDAHSPAVQGCALNSHPRQAIPPSGHRGTGAADAGSHTSQGHRDTAGIDIPRPLAPQGQSSQAVSLASPCITSVGLDRGCL